MNKFKILKNSNNNNRTNNNSNFNRNRQNSSSNNLNWFLPNSLKVIGSCLKTFKSAAVSDHLKNQVTWAAFDRLEPSSSVWRHVLLLGYQNGFQVFDVHDASEFSELVSKRDGGPVTVLQMQPNPSRSIDQKGFQKSHPLMLIVGCWDESKGFANSRSKKKVSDPECSVNSSITVCFYSLRSHCYVHVLRFRSNVCMVRCCPRIVAVGLSKQVTVMDFVSRTVICQFKAHSTPLSALCFDPSGTLLVTASVHGNSINVFRIMPCRNIGRAVSQTYNWRSSSVHLYKFYRGIRAAVIQDICYSRFSQWIAIVSSKGTCHLFVLSLFGGDVSFENVSGSSGETYITPALTISWWSLSTCTSNSHLLFQPPPPVKLSVVSRIKENKSSMLNTVSTASSFMSSTASVPSGALAAVFHNSLPRDSEHLLVYTPSGHVVQHEIQPSFRVEGDDNLKAHTTSLMNITINPVQWWDVCRRSNWSEREDFISEMVLRKQQAGNRFGNQLPGTYRPDVSDTKTKTVTSVRNKPMTTDSSRSYEKLEWNLSNAEVQHSRLRFSVWQKSKISFGVITSSQIDDNANGEYEIEKFSSSKVEKRHKDFLPVFDHFHSMKPAFYDRGGSVVRHTNFCNLDPPHMEDKSNEETVSCHSKPASFSSTESSGGGSSRRIDHLLDLDHLDTDHAYMPLYQNANEHYQDKLGGENMPFSDFLRKNSVGVVSHKETWELHSHGLDADDSYSNRSISSKVNDFVDSGTLIENVFSKKLDDAVGLKEADNRMELTKHDSSHNQSIHCSVISLINEPGKNTSKADERQDATVSLTMCGILKEKVDLNK